jgi:hypothetical protein
MRLDNILLLTVITLSDLLFLCVLSCEETTRQIPGTEGYPLEFYGNRTICTKNERRVELCVAWPRLHKLQGFVPQIDGIEFFTKEYIVWMNVIFYCDANHVVQQEVYNFDSEEVLQLQGYKLAQGFKDVYCALNGKRYEINEYSKTLTLADAWKYSVNATGYVYQCKDRQNIGRGISFVRRECLVQLRSHQMERISPPEEPIHLQGSEYIVWNNQIIYCRRISETEFSLEVTEFHSQEEESLLKNQYFLSPHGIRDVFCLHNGYRREVDEVWVRRQVLRDSDFAHHRGYQFKCTEDTYVETTKCLFWISIGHNNVQSLRELGPNEFAIWHRKDILRCDQRSNGNVQFMRQDYSKRLIKKLEQQGHVKVALASADNGNCDLLSVARGDVWYSIIVESSEKVVPPSTRALVRCKHRVYDSGHHNMLHVFKGGQWELADGTELKEGVLCTNGKWEKTLSCRRACPETTFECRDKSQCILNDFFCNGLNNCPDGSDEENDCLHVPCRPDQFQCARPAGPTILSALTKEAHKTVGKNRLCIDSHQLCDCFQDCRGGEDESVELCGELYKDACECPRQHFPFINPDRCKLLTCTRFLPCPSKVSNLEDSPWPTSSLMETSKSECFNQVCCLKKVAEIKPRYEQNLRALILNLRRGQKPISERETNSELEKTLTNVWKESKIK